MFIVFHCLGDTRITDLRRFKTIQEAVQWGEKQSSPLLKRIAKNPKGEELWIQVRTEEDKIVFQNQKKLVQVQLFGNQDY